MLASLVCCQSAAAACTCTAFPLGRTHPTPPTHPTARPPLPQVHVDLDKGLATVALEAASQMDAFAAVQPLAEAIKVGRLAAGRGRQALAPGTAAGLRTSCGGAGAGCRAVNKRQRGRLVVCLVTAAAGRGSCRPAPSARTGALQRCPAVICMLQGGTAKQPRHVHESLGRTQGMAGRGGRRA